MYFDPLTPENDREINKLFDSLTSVDPSDPPICNRKITTWGRTLVVPESTSTTAKFNFLDLCGQPLSAADYIEVTRNFGTIFLLNVPQMGLDKKDMVSDIRSSPLFIWAPVARPRGALNWDVVMVAD